MVGVHRAWTETTARQRLDVAVLIVKSTRGPRTPIANDLLTVNALTADTWLRRRLFR